MVWPKKLKTNQERGGGEVFPNNLKRMGSAHEMNLNGNFERGAAQAEILLICSRGRGRGGGGEGGFQDLGGIGPPKSLAGFFGAQKLFLCGKTFGYNKKRRLQIGLR